MSKLKVVSTVATGKINREFDLEAVEADINSYSHNYSENKRSGLHLKFYEDGPTVTLHRSGSCNIRGASSKEEAYKNKLLLEKNISHLEINETISDFQITNIVFTSDLEENIELNELCIKLGLEKTEYEPEQFPGLIFRTDPGVVLIFSSGKLVLTGFTNIEEARQSLNKLLSEINDV